VPGAGAYVRGRTQSYWQNGKPLQRRLPMAQWKICLRDRYPAYVSWEQFEKVQAMLQDNYSEYERNCTRGVPRPGQALLHGLVCCGQCGHKMVVQYKGGTQYLCTYLRGRYQVPVCQRIRADHPPISDPRKIAGHLSMSGRNSRTAVFPTGMLTPRAKAIGSHDRTDRLAIP
jgi:hypothetical protein